MATLSTARPVAPPAHGKTQVHWNLEERSTPGDRVREAASKQPLSNESLSIRPSTRRLSTHPAGQHPSRWSSRLDSVYAVYAEMYPEMGQEEATLPMTSVGFASREDERGTTVSNLSAYTPRQQPASPAPKSPRYASAASPWDERGATGLYGGGGRGADDRETGWTRGFAFSPPPPVTGYEEDLRFEEDSTCGSSTPLASPAILESTSEEGRPVSTSPTVSRLSPTTSHSASMLRRAREEVVQATASTKPEDPASEPLVRPVHTIDIAQIKRQQATAAMPVPSEPMLSSRADVKSKPKLPRAPTLRWRARAKKGPSISNPILPPGFVESLGMQTFELHPGVVPPQQQSAPRSEHLDEAERTPTFVATPRAASPPRTPLAARDFASNPKLTPVGFDNARPDVSPSFYSTVSPGKPSMESTESSRGHRTGMPIWAESSMSFDAPASTSSWEYSHGRTDSSESSNSGFRDPWNSSASAHSHLAEADSPALGKQQPNWTGSFAMPPQLPLMQRFREDSVASAYSDHAPSPSSPAVATFRSKQPLDLTRRGENTYSVASLSPSMAAPDGVIAWRFPQAGPPQAQPLSNGFRNPFSSS